MSSSITLFYEVNKPLNYTYAALLDFKKFGELHPYMTSVEVLNRTDRAMEYLVHEKLKLWGIIPMSPCYHVITSEVQRNKCICYSSEVKKGLFLTINFTFEENSNHTITQVTEQITLKGMPWVHAVFLSILKKSHQHVFETLQKESASSSSESYHKISAS